MAVNNLPLAAVVMFGGSGGSMCTWARPARDGLPVVPKAANEALVKGIAKEEGITQQSVI